MTSWGGTVSVTVRRLTRTMRSIDGTSRISPGPRWSISRPRRNTTPRSYSRSTRTEAAVTASPITIRMTSTIASRASPDQLPFLGGADRDRQAVELFDDDPVSDSARLLLGPQRTAGLPERAVDQHVARRLRPAPDDPDMADQALGPGPTRRRRTATPLTQRHARRRRCHARIPR